MITEAIIGFIIGDVLGVPVEFQSRAELEKNPVTDFREYGTWNQPKGTWSDDTSMTLATITSLISYNGKINYKNLMDNFTRWCYQGDFTQNNKLPFDYGNTTIHAILNYNNGIPPLQAGCDKEKCNGNGSLMRILPLAFIPNITYDEIEKVSSLTHAHKRTKIACVLYVEIVKQILKKDKNTFCEYVEEASKKIQEYYKNELELKHFKRIFDNKYTDGVNSTGYVIDTLESVIYSIKKCNGFKETVLYAVNLGGDTDTIGAICGGLAGLYYGMEDIPKEWIENIPKIKDVKLMCDIFEKKLN